MNPKSSGWNIGLLEMFALSGLLLALSSPFSSSGSSLARRCPRTAQRRSIHPTRSACMMERGVPEEESADTGRRLASVSASVKSVAVA